jgi:hypothetical protein
MIQVVPQKISGSVTLQCYVELDVTDRTYDEQNGIIIELVDQARDDIAAGNFHIVAVDVKRK